MNQFVITFTQENMECGLIQNYFCVTSEQTKENLKAVIKQKLDAYLEGLIPLIQAINIANVEYMKEFSVEHSESAPSTKAELEFMAAIEAKSDFDNNCGKMTIGNSNLFCASFLHNEASVVDFSVLTLQEWFETESQKYQT